MVFVFKFFSLIIIFLFKNKITKRQISEFNSRKEDFLQIRYELLYQALLHFFSTTMKNEIDQEKFLLKKIHDIGTEVKINKDNVNFI